MSATFDIYAQIDVLVDKMASDLKTKLRKAVEKNDKISAKQLVAAQKTTQSRGVPAPAPAASSRGRNRVASATPSSSKKAVRYNSDSDSDSADSR
jgi:hypothetical protein